MRGVAGWWMVGALAMVVAACEQPATDVSQGPAPADTAHAPPSDTSHVTPPDTSRPTPPDTLPPTPPDSGHAPPPPPGDSSSIDLGTLGGASSVAADLNDLGTVVGSSQTAAGERHAFVWTANGGMKDLGVFGGTQSAAVAVNDRGEVAGNYVDVEGRIHAFYWSAGTGAVELRPGAEYCAAADIGDAGQVTGRCDLPNGTTTAFVWSAAARTFNAFPFAGENAAGAAIDSAGHVAVEGAVIDPEGGQVVLWRPEAQAYDTVAYGGAGAYAYAVGLNARDEVVGYEAAPGGGAPFTAFVWSRVHGRLVLGILPGFSSSRPTAINEAGLVVGYASEGASVAPFVWKNGTLRDLSSLLGHGTIPNAVNDVGQLAVTTPMSGGATHAVLWTFRP